MGENLHASVTCNRLQGAKPSLVTSINTEDTKRLRAVIVHSILHTDMSKHNDSVGWLRSRSIDVSPSSQGDGELADTDASRELCGALLHCADVGHPCLSWANHKRFSLMACRE